MDRVLKFGNHEIGMRATALTPRLYRQKTGGDLMQDLVVLGEAVKRVSRTTKSQAEQLSVIELEKFENVAYIMAKQYDAGIPDTIEAWLDEFEVFSIYEVLPQILQLWQSSTATTAIPKKK